MVVACAFGQTARAATTDSSNQVGSSSVESGNALILLEFQRMRARIEELEAKVKEQSGNAQVSCPVAGEKSENFAEKSGSNEKPVSVDVAQETAPRANLAKALNMAILVKF